jgi:hypothetical protein
VLFLGLALNSCAPARDRSVEDLVEASSRAYDILEPGLREAAERILDDCRRQAALVGTQPSVGGREAGAYKTEYESEDGKNRKVLTIKTYVLEAEQTTYQYELRGISSITMKASRQTPFEAQVEVLVTQLRRTKDRRVDLPPVPKGYRPRQGAPIETTEISVVWTRPPAPPSALPVPPEPTDLSSQLPEELRSLAVSLKKECLTSESEKSQEIHVLKFSYSAAEKRWRQ